MSDKPLDATGVADVGNLQVVGKHDFIGIKDSLPKIVSTIPSGAFSKIINEILQMSDIVQAADPTYHTKAYKDAFIDGLYKAIHIVRKIQKETGNV